MKNSNDENAKNKKLFLTSIICSITTIIAVTLLVLIAALIELPTLARVLMLIFALIALIIGVTFAVILDIKAGYFECPHCNNLFVPTVSEYVKGYHTFQKRKLTCPKCEKSGMCKKRVTR